MTVTTNILHHDPLPDLVFMKWLFSFLASSQMTWLRSKPMRMARGIYSDVRWAMRFIQHTNVCLAAWLEREKNWFNRQQEAVFHTVPQVHTSSYVLFVLVLRPNQPTNSVELSTSREATSSAAIRYFPAFYGTRRFIPEFTRALHLYLSCAKPIQSTTFNPISKRSILMLSIHLRLGLRPPYNR
jgi:hypothetical protein